jgi:hypothetical protein
VIGTHVFIPLKADIYQRGLHVRLVPLADLQIIPMMVLLGTEPDTRNFI